MEAPELGARSARTQEFFFAIWSKELIFVLIFVLNELIQHED
jgi:hypothetical protein